VRRLRRRWALVPGYSGSEDESSMDPLRRATLFALLGWEAHLRSKSLLLEVACSAIFSSIPDIGWYRYDLA
jgi:hypothetical protein